MACRSLHRLVSRLADGSHAISPAARFALALALCAPALSAGDEPDLHALAHWRAALPDLRIEVDPLTGATRTASRPLGPLTGPRSGATAERIALDFVRAAVGLLGLGAEDLAEVEVVDRVESALTGAVHLTLRQRHLGLPVDHAPLQVVVDGEGRILALHSGFVPRVAAAVGSLTPRLSAARAIELAHAELGWSAAAIASAATLALRPVQPGAVRLVWRFQLRAEDGRHWFDLAVDAEDGRILSRVDWLSAIDSYRVYAVPVESPVHATPPPPADARTLEVAPADPVASPFGWHDVDGSPGAEFTVTEGNNVTACIDAVSPFGDCDPGGLPDGGPELVFDFPIDFTQPPSAYRPASTTQLFYWINVIHDLAYLYGFDEVAGNFQVDNYGRGGLGGDSVDAELQTGLGTNGANFATPPDGSRPRMILFNWTLTTPPRDSVFDAGVLAHEYGHGISNRLIGGPSNVSCLANLQQPGEGISDWLALFLTFDAADPQRVRGIGNYILGQPPGGPGIRTALYDGFPEPNGNPWTYASVAGSPAPFGIGEKWAQAYWLVTWRLIDEHGFEPDLWAVTGTGADAGNLRAMAYLIEGMKLTACSPAFTDLRDGILLAASLLYGGVDVCPMWEAFASYGLGVDAVSGGPHGSTPINGFAVPAACQDPMPFRDGFESGDTSAWSSSVP